MTEQSLAVQERTGGALAVCFTAMASPCELLVSGPGSAAALELGALVAQEAWRIERKYSRYRTDSLVAHIQRNPDREIEVDSETASLLDFASECYRLSGGRFDITSGILRRAWRFDGSDRIPEPAAITPLLALIGLDKIRWQSPKLRVPAGMELDFGGIGKEYAVDRAFELLAARCAAPFLINFGGDLRANRPQALGPWQIGIERPDTDRQAAMVLELERGALATSGDSRRFLLKHGVRYGHILDPHTGWPVADAPRSVTVAASSCTEAGMFSTMALLHGAGAEAFLQQQGVRYWLLE